MITAGSSPLPAEGAYAPDAVRPFVPIPAGTKIRGRFEIIDVLGRGGMSTVYRARDLIRTRARAADPEVALKMIDIDERYRGDAIELMHREARRLLELQHPNIVRVFDSDEDGSYHFIVMELLRGKTLAKVIEDRKGGHLPMPYAVKIIEGISSGITAAHAHGIIHGDLKPGNIFITREGVVKVLDFGTAQAAARQEPNDDDEDATRHYVDRLGAVTPAYASLEMLKGGAPDERDDVFSFAIIAYLMLAGEHPFGRKNASEAATEKLVPSRPADLGRARWRVLSRGLALDRSERMPTVGEFARRLIRPSWRDYLPRARQALPVNDTPDVPLAPNGIVAAPN